MGEVREASMQDADRANVNVKVMGEMEREDTNTRSWELVWSTTASDSHQVTKRSMLARAWAWWLPTLRDNTVSAVLPPTVRSDASFRTPGLVCR